MAVKLYQHPDYVANKGDWRKWRDLYDAEHKTLVNNPDYLWPHYVEEVGKHKERLLRGRKRRSRYLEIPEIVVSLWTSYFFRHEPTLSEETQELLGEAIDNLDGQGMPFDVLSLKATEVFLQAGKVMLLVDAPSTGGDIQPYMQILHPLDVPDWETESEDPSRFGRFNLFRREYIRTEQRASLAEKPEQSMISDVYMRMADGLIQVTRYKRKVDKRSTVIISEGESWELEETFDLTLSEIPVVVLEDQSWIKGVCEETLRHFNLRSARDNIQHQQGYKTVFLIGLDPQDAQQVNAVSENTWPILPTGADVKEITPVDTTSYDRNIQEALSAAFRVGLNQLRQMASDSRAPQSAEALSEEKDERVALVESTISRLETFLNHALLVFAEFKGDTSFVPSVSLNRDITSEDFDEFARLYLTFANQFRSNPQYDKAAFQKALGQMFSEAELAELEEQATIQQTTAATLEGALDGDDPQS